MKQSDFLSNLKKYIDKTARQRNPRITASAIYFMTKQHPLTKGSKRTYVKILHEVKIYLIVNFNWSLVEVHSCFCELNRLLKYS